MASSAQSSQPGGGPESVYTSELSLSGAGTARDVVDAAAAPGAPSRRLEAPTLRAGDTSPRVLFTSETKIGNEVTCFQRLRFRL